MMYKYGLNGIPSIFRLNLKKSKELAAKLLSKVVIELGPHSILDKNNRLGSNIFKAAAVLLAFQSCVTR